MEAVWSGGPVKAWFTTPGLENDNVNATQNDCSSGGDGQPLLC